MQQSGIPFDMTKGTARQYQLMQQYIELLVDEAPEESSATRKVTQGSSLNQARKETKSGTVDEVIIEHTVTGDEHKK
jgi:hypothetical protein